MEKKYIVGIDEGTTNARAVLYDVKKKEIIKQESRNFKQFYPNPGWVEHDAEEIYKAVESCLNTVLEGLSAEEIYGIGITNQRESVVAWNKKTGKPAQKSIVWQCRRTEKFCESLSPKLKKIIKKKTGLIVDAYFSASKMKWMLENSEKVRTLNSENNLCFGTIDSFLLFKLTNGKVFATDITNASRTMLFNINTLSWDSELLKVFGIKLESLPKVVSNSEILGMAKTAIGEIPIASMIGDQQSALFGQGCFNEGMAKDTFGTGCFLLKNFGAKPPFSKKLLTDIAWKIGDNTTYALEGSVFNAGSAITWLVENIGVISSPKETNDIDKKAPTNLGVYFIPAFTGLGAPHWRGEVRGSITGLTRGTNKYHIVRACLESMVYSSQDILNEMGEISELRCDGGVTNSDFLLQFLADLSRIKVTRQKSVEATVLGAIYLAGLATGAFKNLEEISGLIKPAKTFLPKMHPDRMQEYYDGWKNALEHLY